MPENTPEYINDVIAETQENHDRLNRAVCTFCGHAPDGTVPGQIVIKPFTLGANEIDLTASLPLTIGDLEDLKKAGYDVMKTPTPTLEQIKALVFHVCKKSNSAVTNDEVRGMPITWLQRIAEVARQAGRDNLPF